MKRSFPSLEITVITGDVEYVPFENEEERDNAFDKFTNINSIWSTWLPCNMAIRTENIVMIKKVYHTWKVTRD